MNAQDRYVIDEMFKGVYSRLDANFELLHRDNQYIKEQTTKTNGSVARVIERLDKVEKKQALCPREDFNKFKEEMEVTHFYTKNPRLIKYTLTGIFLLEIIVGGLIIATKII